MKYKILSAIFVALLSVCLYPLYAYFLTPALLLEPGNGGKEERIVLAGADCSVQDNHSKEVLDSLQSRLALLGAYRKDTYSIYVKPLDSNSSLIIDNEQMKAASMIKLFIMAEAFRQEKMGFIRFDEERMITSNVKVGGSGILQNAPNGCRKTLRELIDLMIIESDNTATNMLIDRLTMQAINQLIDRLGCKKTLLQRKMMDFESARKGKENYTSAVEVGELLEKIYLGQCVGPEQDAAMLNILLRQEDNDKIPALLPANIKVAHKTGELIGVMHDGGIVYGEKRNYVVCIMTKNSKSSEPAVQDIAAISKVIYQFLNEK